MPLHTQKYDIIKKYIVSQLSTACKTNAQFNLPKNASFHNEQTHTKNHVANVKQKLSIFYGLFMMFPVILLF